MSKLLPKNRKCNSIKVDDTFVDGKLIAIKGRSQTKLTRFFFDHLPPFVDIFYLINIDKKVNIFG